MHVQTDRNLKRNAIKKINKKYNIQMFSTRARGGKAFASEQNVRELKKLLFKQRI